MKNKKHILVLYELSCNKATWWYTKFFIRTPIPRCINSSHKYNYSSFFWKKKKKQYYFGGDLEKSHRKTLQLITTENNPLFLPYHTANALHSHSAYMHHPVIPQTFCSVSTKHTKATLTPFSPARPTAFAQHFQVQVSEPISPVTK